MGARDGWRPSQGDAGLRGCAHARYGLVACPRSAIDDSSLASLVSLVGPGKAVTCDLTDRVYFGVAQVSKSWEGKTMEGKLMEGKDMEGVPTCSTCTMDVRMYKALCLCSHVIRSSITVMPCRAIRRLRACVVRPIHRLRLRLETWSRSRCRERIVVFPSPPHRHQAPPRGMGAVMSRSDSVHPCIRRLHSCVCMLYRL